MLWYRMKTVLIFLFIAINIFLLGLLGAEQMSARRAEKEKAVAAVEMLAKNGIIVEAEVPTVRRRLGTLTLQNPKADAENFAAGILGGRAVQMGEAFRREGRELTFLERGFSYESGATRTEAARGSIREMESCLSEMGFSMEYAVGTTENGAVVFRQEIDGVRLLDMHLSVYPAADGTIAAMEGVWPGVAEIAGEKAYIKSATDALLTFLREATGAQTVTDITLGYAIGISENGYRTADAVPVWVIETADGGRFTYDARQ